MTNSRIRCIDLTVAWAPGPCPPVHDAHGVARNQRATKFRSLDSRAGGPCYRRTRGISLMEVLISIGVIALGIFGVASLIPVAQFKVAEGTVSDRVASIGPSAAAQFRIQGMNDPNNWTMEVAQAELFTRDRALRNQGDYLDRKAYCIDPLWLAEAGYTTVTGGEPRRALPYFPVGADLTNGMLRMGLSNLKTGNRAIEAALARKVFLYADMVFSRPSDQTLNARRQYFRDSSAHATAAVTAAFQPDEAAPSASLSWFATVSPPAYGSADEYVLSIVVVKDRLPLLGFTEDAVAITAAGEEKVSIAGSQHSGEVWVDAWPVANQQELKLTDLGTGDWLLLSRVAVPPPTNTGLSNRDQAKRIYRWTQIIGSSDETTVQVPSGNQGRYFTVANDDFLRPNETNATAIAVRGVEAVFERTIRLEKLRDPRRR